MLNEERENALCGAGLKLSAEMEGGIVTIIDYLEHFCAIIEAYNLKPWGRKGRKYLEGGIAELERSGAYESLMICDRCGKEFLMKLDSETVNLFLKYWKEELDYDQWVKCRECGGLIEKEGKLFSP